MRAVDGVSFAVERGKTLGIVGESGCGKSVTALSIMRLLPEPPARIVGGSITFDGRDLTKLQEKTLEDVRGAEIAMIFQDPMTSLNPTLTIGTQIIETIRRHEDISSAEAKKRAVDAARGGADPERAQERLDDYPHRYSGGMRQRVMIAIALSCNPKLLIADEPTTALDVTVQAQVLDLLEELRDEHEMAMIIITHDMGVVAEAADDVVVMYAGQIVEQANVLDLYDRPEHPYTEALLGALPQLEGEGAREGRLTAIPGPAARPRPSAAGVPVRAALPVRERERLLHRRAARAARAPARPLGALGASGVRARGRRPWGRRHEQQRQAASRSSASTG